MKDLITELLPSTSPEGLLKAYASLTHRIHANASSAKRPSVMAEVEQDLREQRDLVEGELLRRMGARHAPQAAPVLPPRRIVDAPQA